LSLDLICTVDIKMMILLLLTKTIGMIIRSNLIFLYFFQGILRKLMWITWGITVSSHTKHRGLQLLFPHTQNIVDYNSNPQCFSLFFLANFFFFLFFLNIFFSKLLFFSTFLFFLFFHLFFILFFPKLFFLFYF